MGARCFVGARCSDEVGHALAKSREDITANDASWCTEKWVPETNLHITLRFFGQLDDAQLIEVTRRGAEICAGFREMVVRMTGVFAIPDPKRCRMLWATFDDPDGMLRQLAAEFVTGTESLGDPPADREFRAHATLCRARRPKPLTREALDQANRRIAVLEPKMSVATITLYSSRLTSRGAIYHPLAEWPLL